MIQIPKLPKQIKNFLLSERGYISKNSLFKLGILAFASSLFSVANSDQINAHEHANYNPRHVNGHCEPSLGFEIIGSDVDRSIYLKPSCTEPGANDECDMYCGVSTTTETNPQHCNIDNLPYIDNHGNDNSGDSEAVKGDLVFDDINTHKNSLSLNNVGTAIVATHSHYVEACPTKLHFVSQACDNHCNEAGISNPTCSCDETCLAYEVEELDPANPQKAYEDETQDGNKFKKCNTYDMG